MFLSWHFLLGLIFILFYFSFPYLYSIWKKPADQVFVPINNQHKVCNDSRIYAACVQETRLNFFKYHHPCSNDIGGMAIDFMRFNCYRVTALLGFFLSDNRWSIWISLISSVAIQYSLLFYLSCFFVSSLAAALNVSLIVLFFNKVFMSSGIKYRVILLLELILNRSRNAFPELITDNFRYSVTSTSAIFIWLTLLIALNIFGFQPMVAFAILLAYWLVVILVYPPTTFGSVVILFSTIIVSVHEPGYFQMIMVALLSGALAIIVLLATGGFKMLQRIVKSTNQVLSDAHGGSKTATPSSDVKKFLSSTVVLSSVGVIVLNYFLFVNQIFFVVPAFFIFFYFGGFVLGKSELVYRFIERGLSEYLLFALALIVYKLAERLMPEFFLELANYGILATIILSLAIGNIRLAESSFKAKAYLVPAQEWDIYRYINQHIGKRSVFLTFSFSTLQLLPVYTHANLFVSGAEWQSDPGEELWKYQYGYSRFCKNGGSFLRAFDDYFVERKFFTCSPQKKVDQNMLENVHLIDTLLYIPYIKTLEGIRIFNETFSGWTAEFKNHLMGLTSTADDYCDLREQVDYVLIESDKINWEFTRAENYSEVYKNGLYTILGRSA